MGYKTSYIVTLRVGYSEKVFKFDMWNTVREFIFNLVSGSEEVDLKIETISEEVDGNE